MCGKMKEQALISYTANIGGRQYPLKIKPSEKALIEKILADIGDTVAKMKSNYASKDAQDWVAMALLRIAYDRNKDRLNQGDQSAELLTELDQINALIDSMLP